MPGSNHRNPPVDLQAVADFLYLEARLADECRYDEWEALWADDGLYWIPAGGDDPDPERQLSFAYDNRARIASRVRQLRTGTHHTQVPPSRLRRLISNIELLDDAADVVTVGSNFLLTEYRRGELTLWSGRTIHKLRPDGRGFMMAFKKVLLVNNVGAIPTLSFLI
jgi:3-phenylpropionate/cinnamic acid dioxygenase small subunit